LTALAGVGPTTLRVLAVDAPTEANDCIGIVVDHAADRAWRGSFSTPPTGILQAIPA
jgi:hypothetical protein